MQILKFPIEIAMITVSDIKDPKGILHELSEHGKVIGNVFTEGDKVKVGAFLWKFNRLGIDKFVLTLVAGTPKITEGVITKRGLINLKKFHNDYPVIPINDIGVSIDASEIVKSADSILKKIHSRINESDIEKEINALKHKKRKTKEDKERLKELKEELELRNNIDKMKGGTTRELKLGVLITEDDEDFNKIVNQLRGHSGVVKSKRELWAGRFINEDVGLILWHREKMGKDVYWVFLVFDKDTIISDKKLIDWQGPDIEGFKKEFGEFIPIIEIPKLKTNLSLEPSTIIEKLEKKKKTGKIRL